ncbi:MAG: phosphate acyltransferase, partial [Pseudomonadota bacterium]
ARPTHARTLAEIMEGADIFLGLSAAGIVSGEMVKSMAPKPLIFALANPTPEIMPEDVAAVRDDAVMASGRTDYANQINNVLCFPFIFRGALDVGATTINEEMKKAAVYALASIADEWASDVVLQAYGAESLVFGPNYILPKPFDPRLITKIAPAVAKAAVETGVATRPIDDFEAYLERLEGFVYQSGFVMKPIFDRAKRSFAEAPRSIVYAEGEHPYVLQAAQLVVNERLGFPILVGRRRVIKRMITHLGLRMKEEQDYEVCDQDEDSRIPQFCDEYHRLVERKGVSPSHARRVVRAGSTVIAGLLLRRGDADAMICGAVGRYHTQLRHVNQVVGKGPDVRGFATLSGLILDSGPLFIADTYVSVEPSAEKLCDITLMAARELRRFGIDAHVGVGNEQRA